MEAIQIISSPSADYIVPIFIVQYFDQVFGYWKKIHTCITFGHPKIF